jgi:hypothetical protein
MSMTITANGTGQDEDDLRAAFGELVRSLRAADGTFTASLTTDSATYVDGDIPDAPGDDEADGEG